MRDSVKIADPSIRLTIRPLMADALSGWYVIPFVPAQMVALILARMDFDRRNAA